MPSDNTKVETQLFKDLSIRARGGIVIYITVWLITAYWADIDQQAPALFYLNAGLFLLVAIIRVFHLYYFKQVRPDNLVFMHRSLVILILASALHHGLLSAYIIFSSTFEELRYPYMIIVTAFATGGTATLSISRITGIAFPLLILLPTLIVGSLIGGAENLILVVLAIIGLVYVMEAGRAARRDYQNAITNHQIAEARAELMEKLSITDQLTALHNRMYFNNKLIQDWNHCLRLNSPISILIIDLDHFKLVNDTYGHGAGDRCLQMVSGVIKSEIQRTTDTVARYGGEEFVAILPHTDLKTSARIANNLVAAVSGADFRIGENKVPISCSIGIACSTPARNEDSNALLIAADSALYKAKQSGRNRCCIEEKISS
ncbi:MAG: diguanylate cyclase (GGDEF)-like protein [Candidatus Azotimanducaceae bacterium]|jgi:diguanylate cyclase (GGDEF)-like protein